MRAGVTGRDRERIRVCDRAAQDLRFGVQAIKVEMLKAMGAIDSLVDANRLNVQLLAAIPSLLFVALSSRIFFGGTIS
ncbi:MAG: hypothetical protein SGPRY_004212, partial [Prymnesium sp.]